MAVVACDTRGDVVFANPAAAGLWWLSAESEAGVAVAGVTWFCDPDPADSDPLRRALSGGEIVYEWRTVDRGGDVPEPVLITAGAVHDDHGELLGAVMRVLAHGTESTGGEQLRNYAADLEMLTEAGRMLSEVSDPDEAAAMICTVTVGATGAIAILLWKLGDGGLAMSHSEAVLDSDDLRVLADRVRRGAARALAESSTMVERLDELSPAPEPAGGALVLAELGPLTCWHEPLSSGGRSVGMLSIVWAGILADTDRPAALISSLAQHAALALERAELLGALSTAARTDALTGLANRRVWLERLDHELARSDREGAAVSLIVIDIDHFKRYNDRHGHPGGDRLLQEAATAWSQRLRRTDLLARIGGEEFAVILPHCPAEHVIAVGDSLRAAMPDGQTCSIGAVTVTGAATADQVYAAADDALYRAKREGRDRTEFGELSVPQI